MVNCNKPYWPIFAMLLIACLTPAHAWNSTGHMTVAEIAYDNLTPQTRASVNLLLTHQRDYALWMSEMPADETYRARFAFLKAATWPDDIRKTPEDRPIWHYIDIPVVAPGYLPDRIVLMPIQPNVETQITAEAALLTSTSATAEQRATALCWVEHLVGDIHQPLHDSTLFSPLFPRGDKGGNAELLTPESYASDPPEAQAHPHNLHALWDDVLGKSSDPVEIQKLASNLETPTYRRAAFPQLKSHRSVHDWAMEGNLLAKKYAYWNLALPMSPTTDGKADVTLPNGYLAQMHKTSNQQIALAGLRLADLLNALRFPPN